MTAETQTAHGSAVVGDIAVKTTIIALITLLFAAAAPAQEDIQNQLDEIAQCQRDQEGAYWTNEIMRQAEAEDWKSFRDCVNEGILSPSDCAHIWLPGK